MDRGLLLAGAVIVAAVLLMRRQALGDPAAPYAYDLPSDDGAWYDSWLAENSGAAGGTVGNGTAPDSNEWTAPEVDAMGNVIGINYSNNTMSGWNPKNIPAKYASAIHQAELANGMPGFLLARLLYQECHWREDIITGKVKSSAGAVGIAQFMPATSKALGVDPLDPYAAIAAAGSMLRDLYDATGSWALALVSYNWGIGNLRKKGLARAPVETQQYYKQILADIGVSPTLA